MGMNATRRLTLLLTLLAAPAFAQVVVEEDIVIHTSTDLRDWCQRESEARLIGEGHTPTNWRARHFERGNTLMVEGAWRVDGTEMEVACRSGRGVRDEFATVEIAER
jgi:hypothetical protein